MQQQAPAEGAATDARRATRREIARLRDVQRQRHLSGGAQPPDLAAAAQSPLRQARAATPPRRPAASPPARAEPELYSDKWYAKRDADRAAVAPAAAPRRKADEALDKLSPPSAQDAAAGTAAAAEAEVAREEAELYEREAREAQDRAGAAREKVDAMAGEATEQRDVQQEVAETRRKEAEVVEARRRQAEAARRTGGEGVPPQAAAAAGCGGNAAGVPPPEGQPTPPRGCIPASDWLLLLLLCGGIVTQYGWWSLYGDLGLWCGLVGGAMVLAGAVGFECTPGHSAEWNRDLFWCCLFFYALLGAFATWFSADLCPDTGSSKDWGDRFHEDCGIATILAGGSLLCLLIALCSVLMEHGRMRSEDAGVPPQAAAVGYGGNAAGVPPPEGQPTPPRGCIPASDWLLLLLLCGGIVTQYGWWSLYGDLGLWCGLVGGAMVLAGAVGFECTPGHSAEWNRDLFWCCLFFYALLGAFATWFSADLCPDTGSSKDWGDRFHEDCGIATILAGGSLLCLLIALCSVLMEHGRMRSEDAGVPPQAAAVGYGGNAAGAWTEDGGVPGLPQPAAAASCVDDTRICAVICAGVSLLFVLCVVFFS